MHTQIKPSPVPPVYFPLNPELLLNGIRVGVKENIDIAGTKKFASSLTYGEFHGIKPQNAPALQRFLNLVVAIIGKTGMSQLADAEIPPVTLSTIKLPRGDNISNLLSFEDDMAQEIYDRGSEAIEKVLESRDAMWISFKSGRGHILYGILHGSLLQLCYVKPMEERSTFRNEYQARFGRPPYIDPLSRSRWELGSDMAEKHFPNLQSQRQEFQALFEGIFSNNFIMIRPFKFGEPDRPSEYRPGWVLLICQTTLVLRRILLTFYALRKGQS
ncbi:hypothetical protein H9Q69_008292 [Fusarium xylarioides]|nr:hypothetical protein H9Q70_000158 [Fusarium xylarioides]KAG5786193.1 hypothetical protein H9Q73_000133 [Fusarium xylarioides]KAG5792670.1 hypothetical protein H9Q69_008292 [Fusarium xylarioides]KAG5806992.1 hypothetical protein H9Q71_008452 [Fusarium xylarioides]KAG5820467.1 hypothetical protein H9Q74_008874 [Fusarium xylarioides]